MIICFTKTAGSESNKEKANVENLPSKDEQKKANGEPAQKPSFGIINKSKKVGIGVVFNMLGVSFGLDTTKCMQEKISKKIN